MLVKPYWIQLGESPDAYPYGRCPICGGAGVTRCRCKMGDTRCAAGHGWHFRNGEIHETVYPADGSHPKCDATCKVLHPELGWKATPAEVMAAFKQDPTDQVQLASLREANEGNQRWAEGFWLIPGHWPEPKDGPAWEHMVPFSPKPTPCAAGDAPRKSYRYRVQPDDKPWTIAQKFGQPYGAWVRLRQANHDDPGGFSRPGSDCGACSFSEWNPGKYVWIPAEWPDPSSTSPLWNFIDSSYPTAHDAGMLGEPDGERNMIRHTIQRGESSGSIARQYGVSRDALFAANPQLAKTDRYGERDFAREHFKVDGVLNVPSAAPAAGAVGAPSLTVENAVRNAVSGQVGCGCGMGANPWGQRAVAQQAPQVQRPAGRGWSQPTGHVSGCGCAACQPLGPAPMCLPTNPGWNPSFPWGHGMGVEHLLQSPPWAGPGCKHCGGSVGAPSGQVGAACPDGNVPAREDVRFIIPSGKYPGDIAVMFGFNPQQDGSAGALRDANQPWGPGCEKTTAGDTVLSAWTAGKKIKLPLSWFGSQEDQWSNSAYANLRMFDSATNDWTAPYVKHSMPPATGGCKDGEINLAGTCYALPIGVTIPPVGGQCPAGTTNVGGYCVPTTGYPPIVGYGCLPGTTLQNGVCMIPGGTVPTPGTGLNPPCLTGYKQYSDGLCYVPGTQPTGLTPVGYGTATKDEGWPLWAWALIGVGVAGAAVLAISAVRGDSKVTTTRTTKTLPPRSGNGEVVVVDEGAAVHGRRLLPAQAPRSSRKPASRRSR